MLVMLSGLSVVQRNKLVEGRLLGVVVVYKLVEEGEDMKVFAQVHLALVSCTIYKAEKLIFLSIHSSSKYKF